MSTLAIIPARGGSKRIPRKNIKDFVGKPIIAYSIEAALQSGVFDTVMVSTDDREIAEIAKKYGAEVPFLRSAEASTDLSGISPVLLEVLDEYEKRGKFFSHVCCIFPCAPFTTSDRIKEGMNLLMDNKAQSVLPVVQFSSPPQRCVVIRGGRASMLHPENSKVRSQDFEPLYHDVGQFYCFTTEAIRLAECLCYDYTVPLVLSEKEVQDIDTPDDWTAAEIKYQILNG
ncbi:MAG: pseudaminic acid cytidylyltransferase [Defluviitaleaceae bacterium]|nr:pseudaminic acid cytidylyltransferase [Defluviitaleaceae bacterium]